MYLGFLPSQLATWEVCDQVAAGSNQLFTGHIDGVDNIFSEKFWLLFSKANKLKINVNKRPYIRQIEDPEAVFLNF